MTEAEFDRTGWCFGMKCMYQGKYHGIGGCDFEERLIGLVVDYSEDLSWVRCENIELSD